MPTLSLSTTDDRPFFAVDVDPRPDRTELHAHGELDLATVDVLIAVLDSLPDRDVFLDLHDVQFMDATALSTLMTEHAPPQQVVITRMSRQVRRLLDLTGTTRALTGPTRRHAEAG